MEVDLERRGLTITDISSAAFVLGFVDSIDQQPNSLKLEIVLGGIASCEVWYEDGTATNRTAAAQVRGQGQGGSTYLTLGGLSLAEADYRLQARCTHWMLATPATVNHAAIDQAQNPVFQPMSFYDELILLEDRRCGQRRRS